MDTLMARFIKPKVGDVEIDVVDRIQRKMKDVLANFPPGTLTAIIEGSRCGKAHLYCQASYATLNRFDLIFF